MIPTDELVKFHKESLYLDMLYFQYGRYLMLASSRGMDLPSNLQGIWNKDNTPPWECDIHSNINVQMKYWPVENCNLSECHAPFLNYIFKEALDNEVRCKVILFPKNDEKDTRPNTTTWYFKPVRFLGEWKLCFRSSTQGDRTFDASN